jgi:HSP20 family protein
MAEGKKQNSEDQKSKDEKQQENEGPAEEILKELGKSIPGLGGLVKGLEKSPAFREKLNQIDEEVERRLKDASLKMNEDETNFRVRGKFRSEYPATDEPYSAKGTPPAREEQLPDVFDEKDHVKVIAEIPSVKEEDIDVFLQEDKLTLLVDNPDCKYHKKIQLPCAPKGEVKKTYTNGVLEITIIK